MAFNEIPPQHLDPELINFLERFIDQYNSEISLANVIEIKSVYPDKPVTNRIYYFDAAVGSGITAAGYWILNPGGTWYQL